MEVRHDCDGLQVYIPCAATKTAIGRIHTINCNGRAMSNQGEKEQGDNQGGCDRHGGIAVGLMLQKWAATCSVFNCSCCHRRICYSTQWRAMVYPIVYITFYMVVVVAICTGNVTRYEIQVVLLLQAVKTAILLLSCTPNIRRHASSFCTWPLSTRQHASINSC